MRDPSPAPSDLLVLHAAELFTAAGGRPETVHDGGLFARAGRIVAVGRSDEVLAHPAVAGASGVVTIDARGRTVLPGFVDPHTHLVWAGDRVDELVARLRGAGYAKILAAGGGILSTVAATRRSSREELVALALPRLARMLAHGTTTAEAKSGYGLDTASEVKLLEAVRDLAQRQPIELAPTFLGAHAVPAERRDDAERYVDEIVAEQIPAVAERGLAEFCDVFCDRGVFTVEQARRILEAGRRHGLRPRLHAEELDRTGGARLAAELGALSADHLDHATEEDARALAQAGVVGVLLPGVTLTLASERRPDVAALRRAGLGLALATDLNPGTSNSESMPLAIALGCLLYRLDPTEAVLGATWHAARALGRADRIGSLEPGKQADLLVLDAPDHRYLAYHFGVNLVEKVVKAGRIVHQAGATPAGGGGPR